MLLLYRPMVGLCDVPEVLVAPRKHNVAACVWAVVDQCDRTLDVVAVVEAVRDTDTKSRVIVGTAVYVKAATSSTPLFIVAPVSIERGACSRNDSVPTK